MRGVVTLAAAFVIPEGTDNREILLLVAFTVVAGTLLLQGASLPWLARRLRVPSPDPAEDALARATLLQQASKAGFRALAKEEYEDHHGVTAEVKRRVEQRNFAAWEQLGPNQDDETPSEQYTRLRRVMIDAERARVLQVRSGGAVASDVVAEVLAMLDVEESMLDAASRSRDELRATGTAEQSRRADDCPRPRGAPPGRGGREPRVPRVPRGGAPLGPPPPVPRPAVTSGAATPHRAGTRWPTSARPPTRWRSPPRWGRAGAGASCTTSPAEDHAHTVST